jgi:FKBP-type peptidyl-prolyl cis-trans isomerase SlyD
MKVAKEKFVSVDYELTVDGEVVDKSEPGEPLGFVSGIGQIVPGLDKAIQGKEIGDSVDVSFSADEGYGPVQEELLQELPRKNFPDDLEIETGMTFQAETPHGPVSFKVAKVNEDVVVADLNHPLAGKDLNFSVKIAEVRDATKEELEPACDGTHACHSCGQH